MEQPSLAQQIALWADMLRERSALGLRFAQNMYDREHYRTVQDIAMAMMALATGETMEQMEPLRAPLFSRPTPLSVGDGAVIDHDGRMLLIQRADNHKWAMPGGAFEVGETPVEGAMREVFEETGVRCVPVALVGVHDSRLLGAPSRHQLYMFLFLCRPIDGVSAVPASHGHEVLNIGWFSADALPADLDPLHARRIPEAFRVWRGDALAYFDGITREGNLI